MLELVTLPCLADNYAYLIREAGTDAVACIDVPDAAAVMRGLAQRGWKLSHILLTHHHDDHIAGVPALVAATGARVIGAKADAHRLPPLDEEVAGGEALRVGLAVAQVIEVPGHTLGHLAYYFESVGLLFTGDSLMSGGCGRLFEGTPGQMWHSLSKLAKLPAETLVCSGHEYTETNLRFALTVDPENKKLQERVAQVAALRAEGKPTVPERLSVEKATNPFLRASNPHLKRRLGMGGVPNAEVFAQLRARRNTFR